MSHHHPDLDTVEISVEDFTELEERIKASSISESDSILIVKSLWSTSFRHYVSMSVF